MYKVQQAALSEKVYGRIKEMILRNQLVSGQKLNQEKLARELGVSRTPLLSAFSKLEKEFLVELVPRGGAFVRKLTREELEHLYDIRMRLEPLGAYDAAAHGLPQDLEELEAASREFAALAAAEGGAAPAADAGGVNGAPAPAPAEGRERPAGIREADYHYHMAVMKMSHNELLYQIISSFNIIIVSNLEGLLKPARQSLEEHEQILAAIRRRDAPAADRLMHAHLADSRRRLAAKPLE